MRSLTESPNTCRGWRFLPAAAVVLVIFAVNLTALPSLASDGPGSEPATVNQHRFGIQLGGGYGRVTTGDGPGVFGETSSTPDDFSVGTAIAFDYSYEFSPTVSVEGFINFWVGTLSGDLGNESWNFGILGGGFRWRPTGRGFYVRAGIGGGGVVASLEDPESDESSAEFSDFGLGALGTIGYDVAIGDTFMAGPRLEVVALDVGDGVTATAANVLFSFSW